MAPNKDIDFEDRSHKYSESSFHIIENPNLIQENVTSSYNYNKALFNEPKKHRAFILDGDHQRPARWFEAGQIRPDLKEDDNQRTDYSDNGNGKWKELKLTQPQEPSASRQINNEVFNDHVILNHETTSDRNRLPPPNYENEIPTAQKSRQDETQIAEKSDAQPAPRSVTQDNPISKLTPNSNAQVADSKDARDILQLQYIQRSFHGGGKDGNPLNQTSNESPSQAPEVQALKETDFALVGVNRALEHQSNLTPAFPEASVHSTEDGSNFAAPFGLPSGPVETEKFHPGKSSIKMQKQEEGPKDSERQWMPPGATAYGQASTAEIPIDAGDLNRLFREEHAEPLPFHRTTLMKRSPKSYKLSPSFLDCIEEESTDTSSQYAEGTGNESKSTEKSTRLRDRSKNATSNSISLSTKDLRFLAAYRGGAPPQIEPQKVQVKSDENSTSPTLSEMLNFLPDQDKITLNPANIKQSGDNKVRKKGQRTVRSLKCIVTKKLLKLTVNVHEAFENLLKRINLEFAEDANQDSDQELESSKEAFGGYQDATTGQKIHHLEESQEIFSTDTRATGGERGSTKTTTTTAAQQQSEYEFVIRIIHESPQDLHQSIYQCDKVLPEQEPAGTCYFIRLSGISERQVHSRLKLLQDSFDSFFPSYRRWRYGKKAAKRVEFYTKSNDQSGVSFKKVCSIDARGRDYGQCHVFESKIQEVPRFVEVMQPRPGIISDIASDPPGQQSSYVPPGDHRKEAYRLSTFECFPKQTPINVPGLAKNGFFYTGFYDRVKCYSCGRTVEKWAPGDDPSDQRWHKQDCPLARGAISDNIPIGGRFSSVLFSGSSRGASVSSAPQPMEVGRSHTQNFNGPIPRGVDVSDLTRSGGTYQMLPNSTFVIGPTSVQTHQAPLPARQPTNNPPTTRNPPRQWRMANVISADHKRHLTNLYLNRELDRLASFGRWPTGRPNVAPVELARAGFFYLGDMDRTQCYSCGGVLRNWSVDDDAMVEHRTHFPNCRIIAGVERRNVPVPQQAETPMELAEKFPCRFPMNPHMRSEQSRLATFDRRWPADRTRAQPQEIAEAGFFFLGERDRVKCWYCNGGLQNWEYDDVPWIEHAKWFPNCQFLLAKQGQLFVYRYLSLSPHLPRPIIGRQDGASVDPSSATVHSGQTSGSRDVAPAHVSRVQAPSPPPAIIDPQEELRKRRERVEKDLKENDMVKVVLAMGYAENLVRRTLLEKLEAGGAHDGENIYEGTAALLDAVMEKEAELEREREEEHATSIKFPTMSSNYSGLTMGSMDTSPSGPPSGVHQVSGFDDDDEDRDLYSSIAEGPSSGAVGGATSGPASFANETKLQHIWENIPEDQESMKEFIEQKKEERLCKICFVETADMVFIPCSHMCCCMSCTEAIRHCPICRKKIEKAIKTYVK